MAKFNSELPNDLIKELEKIEKDTEKIFGEMTQEAGKIVLNNVKKNIGSSFKTSKSLMGGLRLTKVYKTPSDDGINVHIGFYGYDKDSKPTKRHPKGTPIPLIANAREYGTSRGEAKRPFFRKSFKKKEIEQVMKKVQDKYIKGD
jgi:hypothetical protein